MASSLNSSDTNTTKRPNELRISQPIHHQQNLGVRSQSSPDRLTGGLYTPSQKRRRLQLSPPTSLSSMDSMKIPKKKLHLRKSPPRHPIDPHTPPSPKRNSNTITADQIRNYRPSQLLSVSEPLQTEEELLKAHRRENGTNLLNFSCIDYNSLVHYCDTFGLHDFEYQYHYDLAQKPVDYGYLRSKEKDDGKSARIMDFEDSSRARNPGIPASDSHMEAIEIPEPKPKKRKRGRPRKKPKKEDETEHHYFRSDLLDRHYEKEEPEPIPRTFDPATRLTKSELVSVVREHFLATPLCAEMSEMDVFQQFLGFIVDRRNKLKKEFVANK